MAERGQTHRTNPFSDKKLREVEELYSAFSEGRFQHVVDAVSNRLRKGKWSPISLYLLGMAWLGLEDAAQGAKFLEESIACGGDATAAKQQLARDYFLLGKFGDAAKVLQLLIDDTPGHVSASATLFG